MEREAADQLCRESGNWLSRGRRNLAESLLEVYPPPPGDCLEIGAGSGYFLDILGTHGALDVIEVNPEALGRLRQRAKLIRTIYDTGIPDLNTERCYSLVAGFDVIEHIDNDRGALQWIADHTLPGAIIILTAPAYQWMFSDHDIANQHFRRYTRNSLVNRFPDVIEPVFAGYFNMTLFPFALASRLLWMAKKHLRPLPQPQHSTHYVTRKQSSDVPKIIDWTFGKVLKMESALVKSGLRLPYGLSVVSIARRVPTSGRNE